MAQKKGSAAKTVARETPKPGDAPANVLPATDFNPSGAPDQTAGIDPSHPAVDDNPRENTTKDQNRIDFNDPTIPGSEAVEKNLEKQSK